MILDDSLRHYCLLAGLKNGFAFMLTEPAQVCFGALMCRLTLWQTDEWLGDALLAEAEVEFVSFRVRLLWMHGQQQQKCV